MSNIIAFCGKKGSGKNLSADIVESMLVENGYTVQKLAMADPFKDSFRTIFFPKCEPKEVERIKRNNDKIPVLNLTLREMYIGFAEEIKRLTTKNVFVDIVTNRIKNSSADYFLITDLRFINELNELIKINANSFDTTTIVNINWTENKEVDFSSISEQGIPNQLIDYNINAKNKEELREELRKILNK